MNESEIKQIAINLITTDQTINPRLDYLSPSATRNKQPFLRQNFSLLQHSEVLEIIKYLQEFYEKYSEKDIECINKEINKSISRRLF